MIRLIDYINRSGFFFGARDIENPWSISATLGKQITDKILTLGKEYNISNDIAIHKTASVDAGAILKGPIIISSHCFVGAHAFLRGGVFLDEYVSVGPGCEIKSSLIFSHAAFGHFNFVGDSLVGSDVNMEAGSIVANHYNERREKEIYVFVKGQRIATGLRKFGAVIGDGCKIGANAVLSPGTILEPETIVKRL